MRRALFLATTVICFTSMLPSTSADSSVYSWRDKNGTMTFSDNPTLAPKGVAVEVRSYIAATPSGEALAAPIMQRAFAQRLAMELGLGNDLTAERAAATLAKLGIAPPLGRWHLDEPMTTSLTERLRTLTAGAAVVGKIALDPEQAVIAFDSAVALVGIKIRGAAATPQTMTPEPVIAEPTPQPVYIIPAAPVVYDRVIYAGGGDPFFAGAVPGIVINQRVVNVDKVVVRPRARPGRPQAPVQPRTVYRLRVPQGQRMPITNPPPPDAATITRAGMAQRSAGSQYRVVRVRSGSRGPVFSGGRINAGSSISIGGGYRLR